MFYGEKLVEREVIIFLIVFFTRVKLYYILEIERVFVRRVYFIGRVNIYRNRVKWLNILVKLIEYKKDKEKVELESDEFVTIKDFILERVDKDLE